MAAKVTPKGAKAKSKEEILAGFQSLRQEQRQLANKITELELDLNEHKIVVETLKQVSGSRKCFRMVGGVLAERTVEDILPELEATQLQLPRVLATLQEQLATAGVNLNQYIADHGIRVQKEAAPPPPADDDQPTKSNVLVSQ